MVRPWLDVEAAPRNHDITVDCDVLELKANVAEPSCHGQSQHQRSVKGI